MADAIVGLPNETFTPADTLLGDYLRHQKLGALYAFVTQDDPHSPLMLPVYRELAADHLGGHVPLHVVDARESRHIHNRFLIFSTPTLLWLRDGDPDIEIFTRQVGTVMLKKLIKESDRVLDFYFDRG